MPATLEDIRNLSAEVNALVQAGLPLESHLAEAGAGHGRRLEELTKLISKSLTEGQSLEQAVRENKVGAPRMLAAAVAAGVRTGNLGESIELMGDMADDLVDLRRQILRCISYPLTVVAMGLLLFFVFIRTFLAQVRHLLDDHTIPATSMLHRCLEFDLQYWWWPLLFPLAAVLCLLFWVLSGRAASMAFRGPERVLLLLPGIRGLIRDLQFYNLARMLSLMLERQVPLPDSLLLAGACCGSQVLDSACQRAAADVNQGHLPVPGSSDDWVPGALPPLLHTCLSRFGQQEDIFQERLRSVSGYYRYRLHLSVLWLQNVVPVAMFMIVGGGSVLLYGLTVFWPVTEIYRHLL